MTEIGIDNWMDAIMGRLGNPVGDEEIAKLAEDGQLIVVDNNGKRHVPVKADDDHWTLEPAPVTK